MYYMKTTLFMLFNRKNKIRQTVKFHDFWMIDDRQVASSYQKLWERIEHAAPPQLSKPSLNLWKVSTIVASVALLVIGGLYLFAISHQAPPQVEIVYIFDKASQLSLPDGTNVWMSANSQIRYPKNFNGKTRDVTLEGEAYFEVAHNKKQPFRVLVGKQTIEALGTSFNVRAFDDEEDVKVTLMEGSVWVTDNITGQEAVLLPAQEAIILKSTGSIAVINTNTEMLMSWKTGKYVFNNMTFKEIAEILEKGFNVSIQIENEALKSKPYTARFENGESLEKILDLIRINANYSYYYHNGIVVIK